MTALTFRARHLLPAATEDVIADAAVVVHDGVVTSVGPWDPAAADGPVTDVDGLLLPGFVDAHSHLRAVPLPEHGLPPRPFESWIVSLSAMTLLPAADEAFVATTELLETGVTAVQGFVDLDAAEAGLDSARAALEGIARSGIRALVVLGFHDRSVTRPDPPVGDWARVPSAAQPLHPADVRERAHSWLATPTPTTVALGVGPVGAQWASDELLAALAGIDGDARRHTHLNESRLHRDWIAGLPDPLERLAAAGLLDARLSGAHAVHLTDAELDRVAESGAALVHCPASNVALGVGTARVRAWIERGIPAGLGLDSQNLDAPDMFALLRATRDTAARFGAPLDPPEVLSLATTGGSRALGIPGGGRIAPGSPADLIELSLEEPTVDVVVETGTPAAVHRVWVAGGLVAAAGRERVDVSEARSLLASRLAADADARAARRAGQADTLDLVDRLTGARS